MENGRSPPTKFTGDMAVFDEKLQILELGTGGKSLEITVTLQK